MKIENLRQNTEGSKSRISADLIWEDNARPGINIFFETDKEFADALSDGPESFLVGCILPAWHHGEKRIYIEGEICPELHQNLITAMNWIRHWYYEPSRPLIVIESALRSEPAKAAMQRSGFFFSGGIDCLAALYDNHKHYPRQHPAAFRDGLLIYGQNIESNTDPEVFKQTSKRLAELAAQIDITLIPVHTNIRMVDTSSFMFSINHAAILGAVGHAFSKRLTCISISASDSIPTLTLVKKYNFKPHGSHPVLDPLFGSYGMKIKHDGVAASRLDKVKLISGWDAAFQNIRVCGPNWPGDNCCRCEKCVRTMLELLCAGVLHKSAAFREDDVTPQMIDSLHIDKPRFGYSVDDDYLELIEPLRRMERHDLVDAVYALIDRSFYPAKNLRQKVRRLDLKYFDGGFSKLKKKLFNKGMTGQFSKL